jgi:NAD(P)-dependent dehydrogenase (short-subunit alcohol dehydrogenase family)
MVNNAGIYRSGKFAHEFSVEDLDACWHVNLKGTWFGAQEAIKVFLDQGRGGNIINIVSTAGLQGHPKQAVYNISKGAAANLTRCLPIDYGPDKIRVNGICPTFSKTAMTRAYFDNKEFDKTFLEVMPIKRWGEVEDIANLAVLLASDESDYIHGDLIRIDGGETLCRFPV